MFTFRYQCAKCKTTLQITSVKNDFLSTITGYCGHEMKEAK
jgi:hypothetical protein